MKRGTPSYHVKKWAVMFSSENKLDGYREWLAHRWPSPSNDPVNLPALFNTRSAARAWAAADWATTKDRTDLCAEPHGWLRPKVVRVIIDVEAKQ